MLAVTLREVISVCPNFIDSDRQPLCLCHPDGLMCPSLVERQAHCRNRYDACAVYVAMRASALRACAVRLRASGLDRGSRSLGQ
jgi:hypothetical protein